MDDQNNNVIIDKLMNFVYERIKVNIPGSYYTENCDYTCNPFIQGLKCLLIHIKGNYNI